MSGIKVIYKDLVQELMVHKKITFRECKIFCWVADIFF